MWLFCPPIKSSLRRARRSIVTNFGCYRCVNSNIENQKSGRLPIKKRKQSIGKPQNRNQRLAQENKSATVKKQLWKLVFAFATLPLDGGFGDGISVKHFLWKTCFAAGLSNFSQCLWSKTNFAKHTFSLKIERFNFVRIFKFFQLLCLREPFHR